MRLDKYLADMKVGTRSSVKEIIKKGRIKVNEKVIKSSDYKVSENDEVKLDDEIINYLEYEYIILNKPQDYLSATEDKYDKTIMELINSKRKDLVPVGRLDKDTEGLILITNDGQLNHKLLDPKNHVDKKYYVEVDTKIIDNAEEIFSKPMDLGDFISKPAKFERIDDYHAYLTISEGKFHQVKRMFSKIGSEVIYLKRVSFKNLELGDLKLKEYRYLTNQELEELKG